MRTLNENESQHRYLDRQNPDPYRKAKGIDNVITIQNITLVKPITKPAGSSWNLQLAVFNLGSDCPPNPNFNREVPPCSGLYPNYDIIITPKEGNRILLKTDENGRIRITLDPDSYTISAAPSTPYPIVKADIMPEENNVTKLNLLTSAASGLE